MLQHSRYIEYAEAIAGRDSMLGIVLIFVVCAFVVAYAGNSLFPRVKKEWILLGGFYATFIIVGLIPRISGN